LLLFLLKDRSFFTLFLYLEVCVIGLFFSFRALELFEEGFRELAVMFLVIKVCEARIGLGILVMLARAAAKNYEGGGVRFNMLLNI